jgi:zinc/manganese transport system permease protein
MSLIELFWPAFILAFVLVFIHTVFGLEIIRRGVIFTDLAIGQLATIGLAISITFMQGEYQSVLTLSFAILAALIITWASRNLKNIEAFIGLLYAMAVSSVMLILARSSEGTELFSKLSAADILFTSTDTLFTDLGVYLCVAAVMFFIYPKLRGVAKELLFFAMLAVTVTFSVQSAGVLVVFALLIAPSYGGISQSRFKPFNFSVIFGSVAVFTAMLLSYEFDLPTGYTIIFITVTLSLLLIVFKSIFKKGI